MSFRFRGRNTRRTWTPNARFARRRAYSTGSSLIKRSRGNMRAANQQNDASSVVINLMHSVYAGCTNAFTARNGGVNYNDHPIPSASVPVGTIAVNIYDLLRKSDFFSSYSGMYDQFRINSIKVKVTPTQWSVFDQSRSAINFSNYGDKNTTQYTTVSYNEPPDETEYVPNPDYDPQVPESEENPKKIVPGIPVEPGNYVAIPIEDRWDVYRNEGIAYVVNFLDEDAEGQQQYAGFGFADGIIDGWTKQTLTNVPLRELGNDSTFVYPQALTVITAWDRTGLSTTQFNQLTDANLGCFIVNDSDGQTAHFNPQDGNHRWNLFAFNIGDTISSYSSSQTKQLVGGSNFNLVRYLYPNSQQEKSTYYSTSSLVQQFERDEDSSSHYVFKRANGVDEAQLKAENLTNYLESPVVPFKPTLLIGVLGSNDVNSVGYDYGEAGNRYRSMINTNMVKPVKFNLEFDIGVTFRGLRKTQVV